MALYADSHQQLLSALSAIGREIQVTLGGRVGRST
jgi:hypothetical protein